MKVTPQHLTSASIDKIIRLSALASDAGDNIWEASGAADPELGIFFDPTDPNFQTAMRTSNAPQQALLKILEGLTRSERHELMAMVWLSRDDAQFRGLSQKDAYEAAMQHAESISNSHDAKYLLEKPLHVYLPRTR